MKMFLKNIKKHKDLFLENQFFRPRWYSIFFNPYFISRHALYGKISVFAKTCGAEDRILDVGCGLKPYRNLFASPNYVGIDIAGGGHVDSAKIVDKYYDGKNIPYVEGEFDVVICTQVLEHSEDPERVVEEMFRVLREGGKLYLTVPLVVNEHEVPYDFSRFTQYRLHNMCAKSTKAKAEILPTTKIFGVCGQLLSAYFFESIPFRSTLVKGLLSLVLLGPLQILAMFLDYLAPVGWVTLDYVVIVKKRSQ